MIWTSSGTHGAPLPEGVRPAVTRITGTTWRRCRENSHGKAVARTGKAGPSAALDMKCQGNRMALAIEYCCSESAAQSNVLSYTIFGSAMTGRFQGGGLECELH